MMSTVMATHQYALSKHRARHFPGAGTASAALCSSRWPWSPLHGTLISSRCPGCIVFSPLLLRLRRVPFPFPLSVSVRQRRACMPRMSSDMEGSADLPPEPHSGTLHIFGGVVAFALFLSVARTALAAEPSASLLTPLLARHSQAALAAFKQKAPQVLGVFRDHGLLLSLLLALSAFFSMAETSITTLWPWKVRELAEKEAQGGVFQMLQKDVTRFLTTILIGTTVANIAATALVTEAATTLFGEAGVSAATGVMTVVLLIITEITPKSIAVHNATEVARIVVRPVAWLSYVLYPVGRVVTIICMGLLKILGLKSDGEPFVTEEELKLMLRGAELSGSIEEEEQDMIENVLEIKDTCVREVMTPLVDVVAIDASDTLMDFRNLWVLHQYSRVPVFEKRVDNIVGVAYAMDMLDYVDQTEMLKKLSVGRIVHKPAYFVPDSMSVWNLLREFRIRKVHMAIVLNEYGGTIGIVTLEDVVEEIVGEIFDENDSKEEIRRKTGYIVRRADGILDVDANTSIEDLAEALEVKVPKGPYYYETVSGFVCEAFGYIPRTGESIKVIFHKEDLEDPTALRESESDHHHHHHHEAQDKYKNYKLEILAGNARKVGSVRFQQMNGATQQEGGGGEEEKLVTKFVPRALQFRRVDPQNHNQFVGKTGRLVDPVMQAHDQDVPCIVHPDDQPESRYLNSSSSDIDCVIDSEASISATIKNGNSDQDSGLGSC